MLHFSDPKLGLNKYFNEDCEILKSDFLVNMRENKYNHGQFIVPVLICYSITLPDCKYLY